MDLQKIDIFIPYSNVEGWFSLRNVPNVNADGGIPGLNCGFNTEAPDRETESNRGQLFNELGLDGERVAFVRQVHGSTVLEVSGGGRFGEADAMVTETIGLTLAIQVADCAAVLLADPESDVIGAVHAGWRGALDGVLPNTVQKMMRLASARPDRMIAYISPSICQKHFEVGEEVASRFPEPYVDRERFSKPHVDLKGYLHRQLINEGIPENQVEVAPDCTMENEELYYSYRRDGKKAGRMLSLIRLN